MCHPSPQPKLYVLTFETSIIEGGEPTNTFTQVPSSITPYTVGHLVPFVLSRLTMVLRKGILKSPWSRSTRTPEETPLL